LRLRAVAVFYVDLGCVIQQQSSILCSSLLAAVLPEQQQALAPLFVGRHHSSPLLLARLSPSHPLNHLNQTAAALRPDLFEGMRFEITRPLNQNFFLTHR
jgi:hypothetical protein